MGKKSKQQQPAARVTAGPQGEKGGQTSGESDDASAGGQLDLPGAAPASEGSLGGTGIDPSGAGAIDDPSGAESPEQPAMSQAPLPLTLLPADFLGGFFELCFADKRLVQLCHELKITTPGYRLEALPPDQVARVLADEYLAAEDVRAPLEAQVRAELRNPSLELRELLPREAEELLDLVVAGDPLQNLARVAWKALLSPDEAVREVARFAVEDGIRLLDVPAQAKGKKPPRLPPPGAKEAEEALKRAERAERERNAIREQLAAARSSMASLEQKLAEQRVETERLRADAARAGAEVSRLTAAGEGRSLADARRLADEVRSLAERLARAEDSREKALERAVAAERRSAEAEQRLAATPNAGPAPVPVEELPSESEASSFLVPVLTKEFYDSIDRWDRRMQRAAFDKIHLLARDWRHGSLRAILLEGVPGYYRIRIATDVRLIYRREGARLEILSLIDREDLDRYIKQARTRPT